MEKKSVLVCDNKKVFMKMFKRKFSNEFQFIDNLASCGNETANFELLVFVVYNKFELIDFLKLYKKGTNVLVCIFNQNLYSGLTFLEEYSDLVLLDGSKTRKEIMTDLKLNFKGNLNFKKQISESVFANPFMHKNQSHTSLKNLILASVG